MVFVVLANCVGHILKTITNIISYFQLNNGSSHKMNAFYDRPTAMWHNLFARSTKSYVRSTIILISRCNYFLSPLREIRTVCHSVFIQILCIICIIYCGCHDQYGGFNRISSNYILFTDQRIFNIGIVTSKISKVH